MPDTPSQRSAKRKRSISTKDPSSKETLEITVKKKKLIKTKSILLGYQLWVDQYEPKSVVNNKTKNHG